jgi:hypothetical protein
MNYFHRKLQLGDSHPPLRGYGETASLTGDSPPSPTLAKASEGWATQRYRMIEAMVVKSWQLIDPDDTAETKPVRAVTSAVPFHW